MTLKPGTRRDPARIDRILAKLRLAWTVEPGADQQRLGQLFFNVLRVKNPTDGMVWGVEDDELEAALDKRIAERT